MKYVEDFPEEEGYEEAKCKNDHEDGSNCQPIFIDGGYVCMYWAHKQLEDLLGPYESLDE